MNLQAIIQDEINLMSEDGSIESAVRARARETIEKAIDSAFNSWGGMGKQISKSVEDALRLDFSMVSLGRTLRAYQYRM
jgi:hypothetical protein